MSNDLFKQMYTLSSDGTQILCEGLNGDKHGIYEIFAHFYFEAPGSTAAVVMQPNDDASNIDGDRSADFGAPANVTNGQLGVHQSTANNCLLIVKIELYAARTRGGVSIDRSWYAHGYSRIDQVGGTDDWRNNGALYLSAASNLTSLSFESTANMKAGASQVFIKQVAPDFAHL